MSSRDLALITGGTSGIGKATAIRFAATHDLLIVGRNQAAFLQLASKLQERFNTHVDFIQADLSKPSEAVRRILVVLQEKSKLDVLVNAAGIIDTGTIENTDYAAYQKMMAINVDTVFLLIQASVPFLTRSSHPAIINVSSVTGKRSFPGIFSYSVSKAALDHLTRVAALELAPKGITVNAVNPGVVQTELHKRGGMSEEEYLAFLEHSKSTHPLGRVGNPDEIAELIYFLASEQARWITGETISIDGGRFLTCLR